MRKSLLLAATAAATAMLVMSPMAAASAAPAPHHVLTTGRVGGPNVAVRAVLQAGLKPRTVVTFAQVGVAHPITVTCTRSTITAKVVANPARPGTAALSLTGQTVAGCKLPGLTVLSLKIKLPDRTTISDARSDPVTVFAVGATIKVKFGASIFTCSFKASRLRGHASNTGQTIGFSKQVFTRSAGPAAICPAKGAFSATYGPVVDMSVRGHPHVFVN